MMAICVLLLAMMMIAGAAATAEQVEYLATHPQQSSPADHDHRLNKRMDLEVCIGHFDVHKNTIIRTGESQAIGGKYLQGLELDTIEECERLCCETDACDVYIFERKTGGYCYLFECGPPENFHCKFTRHSNYTSAVLTPQARQTSELASTPRPQLPHIPSNNISQQEWELSNLKLKPEARDKPSTGSLSVAPSGSGSGAGAGVAQAAVNPVQSGVPTAHCSRFQFTCHSGECIAVYNACDGIPQCEDGSDEGPECDTVSSSATKSSGSSSSNSIVEPVKPMVQQYLPVQNVQQQLQVAAQQQQQQQQQQQPQHVIVLGPPPPPPPPPPMVNNREDAAAWANRKMITEGQQQQLQPQQQLQLQQQQQQTGSISTDEQSHIFSHKGGLQLQQQPAANVQVQGQLQGQAQGGAPSVVQVQGQSTPLQVSGYESNQAMYGMSLPRSGMYASQQQQQSQNPQQQLQQASSSGQQMQPNVVWPQQQQQLPVQQQQQPPQQQGQVYAPAAPAPPAQHQTAAMLPVLNAAPAQGKNQAPSVDGDYEDYDEETYTEAPKKKQHKHKKVKAKTPKDPIELALEQNKQQQEAAAASLPSAALLVPVSAVHEQYKMIHENLAMEFRDHDGHSERPGGAVLSLTLGLLVTAALAILIGCRMRTVSRRARRLGGKTPYSQEADFLVNGMYL